MKLSTVNLQIYFAANRLKAKFLKAIPCSIIPKRQNLSTRFQIGITTYIDRYDEYFKPLYLSLSLLFPDVDIFVAVNGFYDRDLQIKYLNQICNDLSSIKSNESTFVLHDSPVGLTRLWNEILSQGKNTTTLLLNDDLKIYPWFRVWVERNIMNVDKLTLINGSWSHFFYNKSLLSSIGYFDEDFCGIGFEDMDYTARCGFAGLAIHNLGCNYIEHADHKPSRTSFDEISDTLWGPKYSTINHKYFFWKWKVANEKSGVFIKQLNSYVEKHNSVQERYSNYDLRFKNGLCYPDRT
jgi:hypothetical protein